jgi:hypothetical protein
MRIMCSHRRGNPAFSSAIGVLAAGMLLGCASQIEVAAEFPTPLVEPLPVRVGLILDEALTQYQHHEEIPEQITWTINLGEANERMLQQLFSSMFASTVPVDALPVSGTPALDGVLKPELEKFEFEVPVRGRDVFAEVWMQYRLRLFEPDGDLIADWPVSGYGKSEIRRANREDSLNQATIVAMREVGAAIATQFPEQPQVDYWLQERQNRTVAAQSELIPQSTPPRLTSEDAPAATNDE